VDIFQVGNGSYMKFIWIDHEAPLDQS